MVVLRGIIALYMRRCRKFRTLRRLASHPHRASHRIVQETVLFNFAHHVAPPRRIYSYAYVCVCVRHLVINNYTYYYHANLCLCADLTRTLKSIMFTIRALCVCLRRLCSSLKFDWLWCVLCHCVQPSLKKLVYKCANQRFLFLFSFSFCIVCQLNKLCFVYMRWFKFRV